MVILGITGGIGSGKSYISSLLHKQMNVPVYDCDTEAKRLICEDDTIRQKLTELAGASVYKNGELQKKVLADYLFSSQQHVQQVNAIVHPAVRKDIGKWVKQQDSPVVAVESAILYESGFDTLVDKVLFVKSEQVEARIGMQQSEQQQKKADFVIDNGTEGKKGLLDALQGMLKKITVNQTET